jgi:hypothetical protein
MPYDSIYYKLIIDEQYDNGRPKHVLWNDGEECFFDEYGRYHRIDGPAIIFNKDLNRPEEYYLHGVKVNSLEELIIKQIIE